MRAGTDDIEHLAGDDRLVTHSLPGYREWSGHYAPRAVARCTRGVILEVIAPCRTT